MCAADFWKFKKQGYHAETRQRKEGQTKTSIMSQTTNFEASRARGAEIVAQKSNISMMKLFCSTSSRNVSLFSIATLLLMMHAVVCAAAAASSAVENNAAMEEDGPPAPPTLFRLLSKQIPFQKDLSSSALSKKNQKNKKKSSSSSFGVKETPSSERFVLEVLEDGVNTRDGDDVVVYRYIGGNEKMDASSSSSASIVDHDHLSDEEGVEEASDSSFYLHHAHYLTPLGEYSEPIGGKLVEKKKKTKTRDVKGEGGNGNANGGGDVFLSYQPTTQIRTMLDPFLVFDNYRSNFRDGTAAIRSDSTKKETSLMAEQQEKQKHKQQQQQEYSGGFPAHPHQGMLEIRHFSVGGLHHTDSCGRSVVTPPGGGQAIFAGRGIVHEEKAVDMNEYVGRGVGGGEESSLLLRTSAASKASSSQQQQEQKKEDDANNSQQEGENEEEHEDEYWYARGFKGFQIWLNVPSRLKSLPPAYKSVSTFPTINITRALPFATGELEDAPRRKSEKEGSDEKRRRKREKKFMQSNHWVLYDVEEGEDAKEENKKRTFVDVQDDVQALCQNLPSAGGASSPCGSDGSVIISPSTDSSPSSPSAAAVEAFEDELRILGLLSDDNDGRDDDEQAPPAGHNVPNHRPLHDKEEVYGELMATVRRASPSSLVPSRIKVLAGTYRFRDVDSSDNGDVDGRPTTTTKTKTVASFDEEKEEHGAVRGPFTRLLVGDDGSTSTFNSNKARQQQASSRKNHGKADADNAVEDKFLYLDVTLRCDHPALTLRVPSGQNTLLYTYDSTHGDAVSETNNGLRNRSGNKSYFGQKNKNKKNTNHDDGIRPPTTIPFTTDDAEGLSLLLSSSPSSSFSSRFPPPKGMLVGRLKSGNAAFVPMHSLAILGDGDHVVVSCPPPQSATTAAGRNGGGGGGGRWVAVNNTSGERDETTVGSSTASLSPLPSSDYYYYTASSISFILVTAPPVGEEVFIANGFAMGSQKALNEAMRRFQEEESGRWC